MVVRKKQSVASEVKNDDKSETVGQILDKKSAKKAVKKPASKKKHKRNDFPANKDTLAKKIKKDWQTASQSQSSENTEEADIIKGHLEAIGKHPLAKGMRVEKIAFSIFLALPENLRGKQGDFSKQWGISENALSIWKAEPEVQKLRLVLMKRILIDRTPAVIENLFNAASTKNAFGNINTAAVKLWLQFVEEWEEASKVNLNATWQIVVNFGFWKSQFIQPEDEKEKKSEDPLDE